MSLLTLERVSKSFGGLRALSEATFEVREGEIVGLIGPNGSGKTTLFNLIGGFDRPDAGSIHFDGTPVARLKPHHLCRMGLARTFQVVRPLPRLTVLENAAVPAFARCATRSDARHAAEEAVAFAGMIGWRDTLAKDLPLGMRKRLELARALASGPKLLLMDENFAGLNPAEVEECLHLVRKIRERGVTLLIIEHNMRVIMTLSDRVVAINHGEKIAEGTPAEVAVHPEVVSAYLGGRHGAS